MIGFAGSPFTVACYMIEGGGSKDFTHIRGMAHSQPQLMDALVDILVDASVTYLSAQVKAGAEVLMLFDSWSGVLSPALFRRLVIAPTKRIVATLNQMHPTIPIIGFPRLAGVMVGEYAAETGVNAVALDTGADMVRAASLLPAQDRLPRQPRPPGPRRRRRGPARRSRQRPGLHPRPPAHLQPRSRHRPATSPDHVATLVTQVRAA